MCAVLPALTHIQFCPVFHTLLTLFFLLLHIPSSGSCSLPPLTLLWEPTEYSDAFYWTFMLFGRWFQPLLTPTQSLRLSASHKHSPDMTRPDSIAYYHLFKISKPGKGRWACPDSEAAERGVLPSGPHWDQHNTSAWSRYITSHQRLQDTRCLSHRTGRATERSPRS